MSRTKQLWVRCPATGQRPTPLTFGFERIMSAGRPDYEERERVRIALSQVMQTLTEQEREVLTLRFGLDDDSLTLKAVGERLGLSSGRISQLQARALRKMRHPARVALFEDTRDIDVDLYTESSSFSSSAPSSSSSSGAEMDVEISDLLSAEKTLTPYLISHLRDHHDDLSRLDPTVFEHLVGEFFASWGYDDVRLVGRDASTSADVFAMKKLQPDGTEIRFFVETKRWRERIGITVVNSVLGAITGEKDRYGWHVGMIVTLAGATDSRRYIDLGLKGIVIKNQSNVIDWLDSYQPNRQGLWLPTPLKTMAGIKKPNQAVVGTLPRGRVNAPHR